MISCYLQGGLGNYMFQIATTYSLSKDYGFDITFSTKNYLKKHNSINYYKNNVFRKLKFDLSFTQEFLYTEPEFSYKKISIRDNTKLNGYFQSEKYFLHNRNLIIDLFSATDNDLSYINNKYKDILNKKTCSIHVRRGDYLNLQNHHPICAIDYYKSAINIIGNDHTFLVFSDDIGWCKKNFKGNNFVFIENEKDYIDIYLMSLCDNNIIANSTFSWWGAWLNKNKNKKIIIPRIWFGNAKNNLPTKDLYPDGWIKL